MSCTDKDEESDNKSAGSSIIVSDESCLAHEGILESTCGPVTNGKKTFSAKNSRKKAKNQSVKDRRCTLNVSLRYGKKTRLHIARNEIKKIIKRKTQKNFNARSICKKNMSENIKTGKRGHVGGKAKEKPLESPEKEALGKYDDDDDESDVSFYSRISLGYFQKFQDKSGASTSYQREDNDKNYFVGIKDMPDIPPEDDELLELQRWGMTALIHSSSEGNEKLDEL